MTHATEDVRTTHRENFSIAWSRLAEARLQQRRKDTPAHRVSVAARLAEIDAVLDAHLNSTPMTTNPSSR